MILLTLFVMFFLDVAQCIDGLTTPPVFSLILAGLFGYLLGSIPTAFLLVQWRSGLDIRRSGSGNVGTLNSYQVSGSRLVGALVLLVDLVKGYCAVWGASLIFGDHFGPMASAGVAAVIGHNFPVWLRFRGGRGLATTAGVFLYLAPLAVLLWGATWAAGFFMMRNVNMANILASVVLLGLLLVLPDSLITQAMGGYSSPTAFRLFGVIILSVVLIGHWKPLVEYVASHRIRKH